MTASRNHSRAGGTEPDGVANAPPARESLPRGRDGDPYPSHRQTFAGITPARAGRSRHGIAAAKAIWNHSRAGGTEASAMSSRRVAVESLPRGRDGAQHLRVDGVAEGITPARAGRSPARTHQQRGEGNHSRAGGTEGA